MLVLAFAGSSGFTLSSAPASYATPASSFRSHAVEMGLRKRLGNLFKSQKRRDEEEAERFAKEREEFFKQAAGSAGDAAEVASKALLSTVFGPPKDVPSPMETAGAEVFSASVKDSLRLKDETQLVGEVREAGAKEEKETTDVTTDDARRESLCLSGLQAHGA